MDEPIAMPPPDAEDVLTSRTPVSSPWLSWTVIVIATGILVFGNIWVSRINEQYSDVNEADQLILLKFQAKYLIGVHKLAADQGEDIDLPISQLRTAMPTGEPLTSGAIAALENFLKPVGDTEKHEEILASLDKDIESFSEEEASILRAVRSGISDPAQLTEADWVRIKESLGWFGNLLAASDGGPDEGKAEAIRTAGTYTTILIVAGGLLLLFAGGVGCVLLIVAIVMYSRKKFRLHLLPANPGAARVLLQCFAIYLGVMAICDLLMLDSMKSVYPPYEEGFLNIPSDVMLGLSLFAPVLCAAIWGLIRRRERGGLRKAAGMHRGQGFFKEVGCGLVGYVAILPVVAIGICATFALTVFVAGLSSGDGSAAPAPISHPIVSEIAKGDWRILLAVLALASIAAPLFEEGLFRGAFHGGMRGQKWNFWIAASISAVIFAAIHPQGLMAIPALGAMGFGFAMLREWRGSLIAPMTAHALHNGTLVLVMWIVLGA